MTRYSVGEVWRLVDRYVEPEPNSGCWLWAGPRDVYGYGRIMVGSYPYRRGRPTLAHRVVYSVLVGAVPKDLCVCHRCDVPCCVNPSHLFVGTRIDNNRDRASKGRNGDHKGERNGNSRLSLSDVAEIRRLRSAGVSYSVIAQRFRISRNHVWVVSSGRSWQM